MSVELKLNALNFCKNSKFEFLNTNSFMDLPFIFF